MKIGLGSLLKTERYFSSDFNTCSWSMSFSTATAMRFPISSSTFFSPSGNCSILRLPIRMTPKVSFSFELIGR